MVWVPPLPFLGSGRRWRKCWHVRSGAGYQRRQSICGCLGPPLRCRCAWYVAELRRCHTPARSRCTRRSSATCDLGPRPLRPPFADGPPFAPAAVRGCSSPVRAKLGDGRATGDWQDHETVDAHRPAQQLTCRPADRDQVLSGLSSWYVWFPVGLRSSGCRSQAPSSPRPYICGLPAYAGGWSPGHSRVTHSRKQAVMRGHLRTRR